MFSDIFDVMYIGLIKTACTLSLIFCLSWLMIELFYSGVAAWMRYKMKREKEAHEFSQETLRRNNLNIIRALLLYLPKEQASMLRYVYMNSGHGAYIPTEEMSAQKLKEQGCLTIQAKEELRGWGYEWASECYYYTVSLEVAEYLSAHIKELGLNWGADFRDFRIYERLKNYQRAGRSINLE